jgi:regulator of nucleoside diphosphate kinase
MPLRSKAQFEKEPAMRGSVRQPTITITSADYDRLFDLAEGAVREAPNVARFLMKELERATIAHRPPAEPAVRMGSHVCYRDMESESVRRVRLVYPEESDSQQGHISVLTPVGAALIGMSSGQTIEWQDQRGISRNLTVLAIEDEADNPISSLAG